MKWFFTTRTVLLEGSLLHECSHQCLAAFDVYWSNMEPSEPSNPNGKCKVKDGGEYYITRGEMYPFGGLMGGGDTRPDPRYRLNTGLFSLHSVAAIANSIPIAAVRLPRTALRGCAKPLRPTMNRIAATK